MTDSLDFGSLHDPGPDRCVCGRPYDYADDGETRACPAGCGGIEEHDGMHWVDARGEVTG